MLEGGYIEMCEQNALMFGGRIAYDNDYSGLAIDQNEEKCLAAKLGINNMLFLASHGVVVTGASIAQAFTDLCYLARTCMFQFQARSTGGKLRTVKADVRETVKKQFSVDFPNLTSRRFIALKRILDNEEEGFRA